MQKANTGDPDKVLMHLQQLIRKYDCVIIPGLGGFILQDRPASFDERHQLFHPPSRRIKFNGLLKDDDGLLEHSLVTREKMTYLEAKGLVDEFVSRLISRLHEYQKTGIPGIGSFRFNREGGLAFEPEAGIDLLDDGFGLTAVSVKPLEKKVSHRLTRKPHDRKRENVPTSMPRAVTWTVAMAMPVIFFLCWGIISPASVQRFYASYTGIIPVFSATDMHINGPEAVNEATLNEFQVASNAGIRPGDNSSAGNREAQSESDEVTGLQEEIHPPVVAQPRYYVIGGAFLEDKNTERFVEKLRSKGYEPEIAGHNRSGQARVSYKSFSGKSEALEYLAFIRDNENPGAWLLRY